MAPDSGQGSSVADFVDGHRPHLVRASRTVCSPAILPVEALSPLVSYQDPQHRLFESLTRELLASLANERAAKARVPTIGIDVQGVKRPDPFCAGVSGWPDR